mmetsp:Transcript_43078/g.79947  ORF Transcript_43078/g.79947 Transcript_43078/m.79947 type:complete len:208 (+) Transcript_43078:264-887(+)
MRLAKVRLYQRPLLFLGIDRDLIDGRELGPVTGVDGLLKHVMILRVEELHVLGGLGLKVPVAANVPLVPKPVALHAADRAAVDPAPGQAEVENFGVLVDELDQGIEFGVANGEFLDVKTDFQVQVLLVVLEGGLAVGKEAVRVLYLLARVRVRLKDVAIEPKAVIFLLARDVVGFIKTTRTHIYGCWIGCAATHSRCLIKSRPFPQE